MEIRKCQGKRTKRLQYNRFNERLSALIGGANWHSREVSLRPSAVSLRSLGKQLIPHAENGQSCGKPQEKDEFY